ncbi:MAG: hypothetical protein ABII00_09710 [Elusimicrobiota bacterium]
MTSNSTPDPDLPGCAALAPLMSFDPKALLSEDRDEQEVCDFVLMLSVVYNDFKDLIWAYHHLDHCRQPEDGEVSSYNGQYVGMRNHLTRLFHSLIFEFTMLLRENKHILDHALFRKTLGFVSKENRTRWAELLAFSRGEANESAKDLLRISMLLRHNITSHYYKPTFLAKGYKSFFENAKDEAHSSAFISRGMSLDANRLYFADAALDGCIKRLVPSDKMHDIRQSLNAVADFINRTLMDIVEKFIQARGFAWREHSG